MNAHVRHLLYTLLAILLMLWVTSCGGVAPPNTTPAPAPPDQFVVGLGVPDETEICIEQWPRPLRANWICVSVEELRRTVTPRWNAN